MIGCCFLSQENPAILLLLAEAEKIRLLLFVASCDESAACRAALWLVALLLVW